MTRMRMQLKGCSEDGWIFAIKAWKYEEKLEEFCNFYWIEELLFAFVELERN